MKAVSWTVGITASLLLAVSATAQTAAYEVFGHSVAERHARAYEAAREKVADHGARDLTVTVMSSRAEADRAPSISRMRRFTATWNWLDEDVGVPLPARPAECCLGRLNPRRNE
jgi:hypothetical protein